MLLDSVTFHQQPVHETALQATSQTPMPAEPQRVVQYEQKVVQSEAYSPISSPEQTQCETFSSQVQPSGPQQWQMPGPSTQTVSYLSLAISR
jgi:hypothetical protein